MGSDRHAAPQQVCKFLYVMSDICPAGSFTNSSVQRDLCVPALRSMTGNSAGGTRVGISRAIASPAESAQYHEALAGPINEEDYEETPPLNVPFHGGARELENRPGCLR